MMDESYTQEKNYIVTGPEFGDKAGRVFIIIKALYGLRSSGKCYPEKFSETLRDMGFFPSKADPDVWMRAAGTTYEYIAVYVDNLCLARNDPAEFFRQLREIHNYKLKGDGPLKYHLGCDYELDPDGTLRGGPRNYINKIVEGYERMFGELPKEYTTKE